MDEDAYLRIEATLIEQALRLGASGLGDRSVQAEPEAPDAPTVRFDARERVLRRLEALERFLVLLDSRVARATLEKLQGLMTPLELGGRRLSNIVAELPGATADGDFDFDLTQLPDLEKPRARLADLRRRIESDRIG